MKIWTNPRNGEDEVTGPYINVRATSRQNLSSGFPTRSDTNRAVQRQKMARGLTFRIYIEEEFCLLCSVNKGAICVVTAQLIWAFNSAYAKSGVSHDAASIHRYHQLAYETNVLLIASIPP